MLNKLFDKVNSICPVKSIYRTHNSNGPSIEVIYKQTPTTEQYNDINFILNSWPLDEEKIKKNQLLEDEWKIVISNGWTTPYGYKLGIDTQDIALLNGLFTLGKEASSIGINDPISIVDLNGVSHSLSLQDLTLLMLQYGQARSLLSSSYASIKQAINSAISIEELNSVNLTIGA